MTLSLTDTDLCLKRVFKNPTLIHHVDARLFAAALTDKEKPCCRPQSSCKSCVQGQQIISLKFFFFFYITRLRGLMFAWSRCGLWVTAYSTLTVTILYAKRQRSFLVNPRGLSSNLSTWFTKSFSTSSGRSPVRTNVYVLQHSCLSQQFASLGLLSSYCEVRASQLGPISPVRYASNTLSIISSSHFPYLPRFDILISTQIENHQKDI